jgi:hypothetical protein
MHGAFRDVFCILMIGMGWDDLAFVLLHMVLHALTPGEREGRAFSIEFYGCDNSAWEHICLTPLLPQFRCLQRLEVLETWALMLISVAKY